MLKIRFHCGAALCIILLFGGSFQTLCAQEKSGEQIRTALVLSGGGARGFAQIGVLKAFEEIGFYPDIVVGTSVGAIIGALYASGYDADQIAQYLRATNWEEVFSDRPYREIEFVSQKMTEYPALLSLRFDRQFNVIFPRNLLSTQGLQERLFQITVYPNFAAGGDYDSLAIPFRAVATNIHTGNAVVLRKGILAKTLSASASFPFVLAPVREGDMLLVDGGLTNNVPCDVAWEMGADFIIAVDVSSRVIDLGRNFDPLQYFGQALNTLSYPSDTRNLGLADILILPEIGNIGSAQFDSIDVLIQKGYEKALEERDKIQPYCKHRKPNPDFLDKASERLNHTYIRNVLYRGNARTRPFIIQRELLFKPGDIWNPAYARRSIKNVFSSGLFENVYLSLENASGDSVDLVVEVDEYERSLFSFGTHYDNEREARAFIAFEYRNLLGIGLDNQFSIIASNQFRKFEWDLRTTRIFTSTMTGFMSLYHIYEDIPLYQNSRRAGFGQIFRSAAEANAGVQISRVGLTSVGIKYERFINRENASYTPIIDGSNYDIASLQTQILVENPDDRSLPTRGHQNHISYSHSISADEFKHVDRISFDYNAYDTFFERYILSTKIRCGYLNRALSFYEKFRLGGIQSLPGFHQDELWGNILLGFGLGLRAPLSSGSFYRLNLMFGNVWNSFDDFQWDDLKLGGSAGILIPTPLGPLTADLGIDSRAHMLFYFSIGHSF